MSKEHELRALANFDAELCAQATAGLGPRAHRPAHLGFINAGGNAPFNDRKLPKKLPRTPIAAVDFKKPVHPWMRTKVSRLT